MLAFVVVVDFGLSVYEFRHRAETLGRYRNGRQRAYTQHPWPEDRADPADNACVSEAAQRREQPILCRTQLARNRREGRSGQRKVSLEIVQEPANQQARVDVLRGQRQRIRAAVCEEAVQPFHFSS